MLQIDNKTILKNSYKDIENEIFKYYYHLINSNKYNSIEELQNLLSIFNKREELICNIKLDMKHLNNIIIKNKYSYKNPIIFTFFKNVLRKYKNIIEGDIFDIYSDIFYETIEHIDEIDMNFGKIYHYMLSKFINSKYCDIDKIVNKINSEHQSILFANLLYNNNYSKQYIVKLYDKYRSYELLKIFKQTNFIDYINSVYKLLQLDNLTLNNFIDIYNTIIFLSNINLYQIRKNLDYKNIYSSYLKIYLDFILNNKLDSNLDIIITEDIKKYYSNIDDKSYFEAIKNLKKCKINNNINSLIILINEYDDFFKKITKDNNIDI